MAERSAEDLLDWAFGFLCNAAPIVDDVANTPEKGYGREAITWLEAWNLNFKPAYHEWLDDYVSENQVTLGVATPQPRESLDLDALVLMIKRTLKVTAELNEPVVPVLVDTLQDIYEELSRLQDLER